MSAAEQVPAPPERTIFEDGVMFRVIEETAPTNWITLASYASRVEAEAFLDGLGFTMAGRSKVTARTYVKAAATVRAQQAAQDRHRRLHNERVKREAAELVRLVRDEDCPACGWPETSVEGVHGPELLGCSKCGWSVPVASL